MSLVGQPRCQNLVNSDHCTVELTNHHGGATSSVPCLCSFSLFSSVKLRSLGFLRSPNRGWDDFEWSPVTLSSSRCCNKRGQLGVWSRAALYFAKKLCPIRPNFPVGLSLYLLRNLRHRAITTQKRSVALIPSWEMCHWNHSSVIGSRLQKWRRSQLHRQCQGLLDFRLPSQIRLLIPLLLGFLARFFDKTVVLFLFQSLLLFLESGVFFLECLDRFLLCSHTLDPVYVVGFCFYYTSFSSFISLACFLFSWTFSASMSLVDFGIVGCVVVIVFVFFLMFFSIQLCWSRNLFDGQCGHCEPKCQVDCIFLLYKISMRKW